MGSEILKSFSSARTFASMLLSWGLPVLVAMVLYVVVVGPSVEESPVATVLGHRLARVGLREGWLLLASWAAVTLLLGFNAKGIYRRLEGYSWPHRLSRRRKQVHQAQLRYLVAEREWTAAEQRRQALIGSGADTAAVDAADQKLTECAQRLEAAAADRRSFVSPWRRVFSTRPLGVLNSYMNYPADPALIMPTKIGNRLKAAEVYSVERWGFDLITLWYELLSCASEQLVRDLEDARHSMDNYVAASMCAAGLSAASIGSAAYVALHDGFLRAAPALALAIVAGALVPVTYRAAVAAVSEWQRALAALANSARRPVAALLGLRLPEDIELEKHMWEMVTGYVGRGTDRYARELNWYRLHYAYQVELDGTPPRTDQAGSGATRTGV